MAVAIHSDVEDNRLRGCGRLTTSEKLSDYVNEFYRGSLDGIALSVDEDCDARQDVITPRGAFKFHPFYFSIGIVFPFSDFQSEFLSFYSYAPCQWTPESYRLLLAFDRLNNWYNIGMGLNEFRALFRVTCQSTLRQYISFHATGKWTEHPFVQGVKTDRDWSLDVITVSGKWESPKNKFPIPTNWKHEKNLDALNRVDAVRVDLIDAFYSIPSKFRDLEWVINPINDKAEGRDWVLPFVDVGANPIIASADELKIMYDKHLVLLGKKKLRRRKGSGPAGGGAVECTDQTRKRKLEVMNPNSAMHNSSCAYPNDEASMSDSMPFGRTTEVVEVLEKHSLHDSEGISPAYRQMQAADPMKRQADYIPLSNDSNKLHNITSSSTMNDETGVLFLDPDNLPQLRSIKDGFAAEIWSDAIFSPTDATLWLSQTIQSLQEDVFLGWYQNMGRTKALIYKYASLLKEATEGWEIDKVKLMTASNKCHALEEEISDWKERFGGMRDNLENQVAAARFGIESKNKKIAILEQHIAEMKASHEKDLQNLRNQHEARLIEMEDQKCAAVEIARESVMKELVGNSDEDDSDGPNDSA